MKTTTDIKRVLDLPIETPPEYCSDIQRRVHKSSGTWKLRPVQYQALWTLRENQGLLGNIGVGHGKTLIACLAGTVLRKSRVVVLIPASLRLTFECELLSYMDHFNVVTPTIVHLEELGLKSRANLLEDLNPEVLVIDEAHYLKNPKSARTRRVLRFVQKSRPVVVAMSGTLTSRSLWDFAHLAEMALGERAPVPLSWGNLTSWALCVDAKPRPGEYPMGSDWQRVRPLCEAYGAPCDREGARTAFQSRLTSAPGVLSTEGGSFQGGLEIHSIWPSSVPSSIRRHLKDLEDKWELPDGTPLTTNLELSRARTQISQGWYYRTKWPDGPDREWLKRRSEWSQACARVVRTRGANGAHLDTPAQVIDALEHLPSGVRCAYDRWTEVMDRWNLDTMRETVWLHTYLVQDVAQRTSKGPPTLVWYDSHAMRDALSEFMPVVPEGEPPSKVRTCAVSIWSHATGMNLQSFSHNLILAPFQSGTRWEQLLGRTHRPGQESDTVEVQVYTHVARFVELLRGAHAQSEYIQQTTGQPQKLLQATWAKESCPYPLT